MVKKITPPAEYSAPRVEVLELVSEQPVFQLSYGEDNEAGSDLGEDEWYYFGF